MKYFYSIPVLFLLLSLFPIPANAQADADTKARQLEEIRKLKQQQIEEQKLQNDWNKQNSEQEIKKLNRENQQKNFEIAVSKDEVQRAKQEVKNAQAEALNAKRDLDAKKKELQKTQSMIDLAKGKLDSIENQLSSTQSQLSESELVNKRIREELQHQEDSTKMLRQEQELQSLVVKNQEIELESRKIEIEAQKQRSRLYIIAAVLGISLFLMLVALLFYRQKTIRELGSKNKIIEEEKRRSDELLLNILPSDVMHELKAHGKTQPRNFAKATVLFADIKNFTAISEVLSPDDLIEGLDAYFEKFDEVIEKYGIEKIKTIGDAYVCAGGVPTKSEGNPHLVVQAALDFVYEIEKLKRERNAKGKIPFEFRIGIHTGQLVAGVIGIKKFAYDIWGDTVNMAARMEAASETGKINISGTTYELVKDKFACLYRGKVEAKNKGEIDMYFVEKAMV